MLDDRLILRGADGYDEARFARVFNARRPERYPAAVLAAESEDDVVGGVRLARDRGWKVAIRAGGHSFPAWSLRDDALLIDLGGFKETALDESTGAEAELPMHGSFDVDNAGGVVGVQRADGAVRRVDSNACGHLHRVPIDHDIEMGVNMFHLALAAQHR